MSQQSHNPAGSSQPYSTNSSLHYHRCWWAWCRENFYSKKDLLDHVISEHVRKAQPVRLADVPTLQKMDKIYWDSLDMDSLPMLPSSSPVQSENVHEDGSHPEAVPSPLPSPPASTPHEIPNTPVRIQSFPGPPTNINFPKIHLLPHDLLTPFSQRDVPEAHASTPTFASLSSSPMRSEYPIPESPSLDALISQATKTRNFGVVETGHPDEDVSNQSGTSSQQSVFNQLTQGTDDEEPSSDSGTSNNSMAVDNPSNDESYFASHSTNEPQSNLLEASTPLHIQTRQLNVMPGVLPTSPSYLHYPVYPFASTTVRQPWYSAPRRRSSKKISASEAQATQSPVGRNFGSPVDSLVIASFQPAATRAGPAVGSAASIIPQSTSHSDDPLSQSQESSTRTDNTQISSYPPLQTQAPYHSQSMSQD